MRFAAATGDGWVTTGDRAGDVDGWFAGLAIAAAGFVVRRARGSVAPACRGYCLDRHPARATLCRVSLSSLGRVSFEGPRRSRGGRARLSLDLICH